MTHQNKVNFT